MSKKILLVEDEALIAMNEAQMLQHHGYEVVTAYNGEKAIETAKENKIDLILMDIDLGHGKMSGTEAAEIILQEYDIPVVFLSSHTEPEVVETTEKITSYGYVVKNSADTVLLASLKMAFRLFDAKNEAKKHAEALRESEATIRKRLKAITEPEGDIGTLELADIIDYEALQTMMEDFYNITGIGCAINDTSGKILVSVGWQDICTKFHRVHPDTLKNCLESDVMLSRGVPDGTFKVYHCKNNMWDSVTPIEVGGKHLGNIFLGQFFYEGEVPDYDLFKKQALQYGFDETEYLDALDRVPRFSRETVNSVMTFFSRLAGMISSLSYSTVKLSKNIVQHKQAEDALTESEENLRITLNSIGDAVISTDIDGNIIRMNPVAENLCGWSTGEAKGKCLQEVFYIVHAETGKTAENPVAKVLETGSVTGLANHTMLISKDGEKYQIADSAAPIRDNSGHTTGVVLVFRDVTETYEKERELRSIEWMLSNKTTQQEEYLPGYGDLSNLNKDGHILHSVGKEHLKDIASEYLDLLETSTAIYEKDGGYALGIFTSGWCRLMDRASRKLCNTDDNREALESGKWLCHESCWNVSALAMSENRPAEVTCNGGIRMYAVPVNAGGETVGAINFGYGSPPTDKAELESLSNKYKIPIDELRRKAEAYNPRPQFIIDYAKERIHTAATQLGRILDLKRNEQELAKKTTLLEESQELAHLGSWEWDIVDDRWTFSEQWKQIHGVSDDDLKTSKLLEIAHPEDAPYIEKAFLEAKEDGKPYNIQYRIIRADNNETRYIHAIGEVEYSRDTGGPIRMVGTVQDITERRQAEEELKTNRDLLDATQRIAGVGGWEWDVARQTMTWADQTYLIHGFEPGEVAAGSPEHIRRSLACYDPDDRPKIEKAFRKCVEEGEAYTLEVPLTTSQGRRIWVQTSAQAVLENGKVVKVQGHIMDITGLKRAEEKLREALGEKDFLMQELNHRVKNNLLMVSSLISLKDSETADDLSDIQQQIEAISLIHEKLYQADSITEIGCREYIGDLLNSIFSSFSRRPVRIEAAIDAISIPAKSAMPLGLIVNEIATNAIKHGFNEKEEAVFSIQLEKDKENNQYELTLSNTGKPFPENIGVDNPQTLGLRIISALTGQLGGSIDLKRVPRPVFIIRFPVEEE